MRIAVCNHHWATAGGGESYALALAAALRDRGEVDLVTPPGVDWDRMSDALGADLRGLRRREIDFDHQPNVRAASADYDLFVNTTFATDLVPAGGSNVLVVHFPTPPVQPLGRPRALAAEAARRTGLLAKSTRLVYASGFYGREQTTHAFRWTDGDAVLMLGGSRRDRTVDLTLAAERPDPTDVTVHVNGVLVATVVGLCGDRTETVQVLVPASPRAALRLSSSTFRPSDVVGGHDHRPLGVQLVGVHVHDEPVSAVIDRLGLADHADGAAWFATYDQVIANSGYTRDWLHRWWGQRAAVVHPAVRSFPRQQKRPIILAVGRFFPPDRGHSKHQVELVRVFRRLVESDSLPWELHLVGGCQPEDMSYLRVVEDEARGLPVHLHMNAEGSRVAKLFGEASVFWHATGLGELPERAERHEHFGIAVVEAMSAGAVPIVYGRGGPAETVRPGVDGLHFLTEAELEAATRTLVSDTDLWERLSAAAERRAAAFRFEAMTASLDAALRDLDLKPRCP